MDEFMEGLIKVFYQSLHGFVHVMEAAFSKKAAHLHGLINGRIEKRQLIYMVEFMEGLRKDS